MKKFKDRDGDVWRDVGDGRLSCDPNQGYETSYCPPRWAVEALYGPLTDVTDTGEPLNTDDLEPL